MADDLMVEQYIGVNSITTKDIMVLWKLIHSRQSNELKYVAKYINIIKTTE